MTLIRTPRGAVTVNSVTRAPAPISKPLIRTTGNGDSIRGAVAAGRVRTGAAGAGEAGTSNVGCGSAAGAGVGLAVAVGVGSGVGVGVTVGAAVTTAVAADRFTSDPASS